MNDENTVTIDGTVHAIVYFENRLDIVASRMAASARAADIKNLRLEAIWQTHLRCLARNKYGRDAYLAVAGSTLTGGKAQWEYWDQIGEPVSSVELRRDNWSLGDACTVVAVTRIDEELAAAAQAINAWRCRNQASRGRMRTMDPATRCCNS